MTDLGGVTIGVEEEFLLADRTSRRTVPLARAVLARVRSGGPGNVHAELLTSQVEASTGGDDVLVLRLLKELLVDGTGAERQRSAAVRGRAAAVDFVAERTTWRA